MLDFIATNEHAQTLYDGLLVTTEFREQHEKLIKKFIFGRFKLDAKQGTPHCLLTAKTSKSARPMFAPVQVEHRGKTYHCLAFLEKIEEQHKYTKSNYLNNPNAFTHFIAELPQKINFASFDTANAITEVEPDNDDNITLEPAFVFNNNYIFLSDTQNQIFAKPLPLTVSGSAGAGKSLLALLKLASFLEQFNDGTPKKLLFTADSEPLVKLMQENWLHLPLSERPANIEVEFSTLDALLKKATPELANATRVNADREKSHFNNWLIEYVSSQKKPTPSQPKPKNKRGKYPKKQTIATQSPFEIIATNANKLYQEFRIISGCKNNKEIYVNLGAKQSLFIDKKQRELCFDAYQKYLQSLASNHQYDTSFTPFELADEAKYDGCVCDEWLDCSPLQTQQLFESTRNAQILFCGDVNQTLTDTIPSYAFLEQLCHDNHVNLSELNLPGSYRCPSEVIEFANTVLDIKFALVGSAVKKAQGRISINESEESNNRKVFWLEKLIVDKKNKKIKLIAHTDSEDEPITLTDLSESGDFAMIVFTQKQEDEMQRRFPKATVFYPHEIKGLQYRVVMVSCPFEDPTFETINKEFSPETISDGPVHRPKQGKEIDPAFAPLLNTIYMSLTRTTEILIVYQPDSHKIEKIIHHVKPSEPNIETFEQMTPETFAPATREQYIAEVEKLWSNGNQRQAQQIIHREKLVDEPKIKALLNPIVHVLQVRQATTEEQKIFDGLYKAKTPKEFNKVFRKISNLDEFFNFLIFKLPHELKLGIEKPYLYHAITRLATLGKIKKDAPKKEMIAASKFYEHFSLALKEPEIAEKIFSSAFFTPRNYDENNKNFFLGLVIIQDEELREPYRLAIKKHLEKNSDALQVILDNLFEPAIMNGAIVNFLFTLMGVESTDSDTDLIASLILEKYKSLSDQQIKEELFIPNKQSLNFTLFYILTCGGTFFDVIKKIFEKKPGLYRLIRLSNLFSPAGGQNSRSVAHNILDPNNDLNDSTKIAFLREFFDKNPSLADDLTLEDLCNIQFFNRNLFFTLCESADGIAFLQFLFDKNPSLLEQLPISALFGATVYKDKPFYAIELLINELGLELVRAIFKKNRKFSSELTISNILSPSSNVIKQLIQQQAYDIFELMFENNPKLVFEFSQLESITDPTLKAIVEKYLAYNQNNVLRAPTEKEKEYISNLINNTIHYNSILTFLESKFAVDYLLNTCINGSNALTQIALKNVKNLQHIVKAFTEKPALLEKFRNPGLFRVRENQYGDITTKSTFECLQTTSTGKELIFLLFENPRVIQLRKATVQEQKQFEALLVCKNAAEFRTALARISNVGEFFNVILFDFIFPKIVSSNLIVTLINLAENIDSFPKYLTDLYKNLCDFLTNNTQFRNSIFSASYFSLLISNENPGLPITSALATQPNPFEYYVILSITEHLKNKTPALTCLLENFFVMKIDIDGEHFHFSYLEDEYGKLNVNLIVDLILEKYKDLSDEALCQQLSLPILLARNHNVLQILASNEKYLPILNELFNRKPSLYASITTDTLLKEYSLCNKMLTSVLYQLIQLECFDLLYKIFNNKPHANNLEPDKFYFSNHEFGNTIFQRLCMHEAGLDILKLLFGQNRPLLMQMKAEHLFSDSAIGKLTFSFLLSKKEKGIDLIRTILNAHHEFCLHITIQHFLVNIRGKSENTYRDLIALRCYDIFELMFKNNRNLAIEFSQQKDITDPTLKKMIQDYLPTSSVAENNRSFFHQPTELVFDKPQEHNHKQEVSLQQRAIQSLHLLFPDNRIEIDPKNNYIWIILNQYTTKESAINATHDVGLHKVDIVVFNIRGTNYPGIYTIQIPKPDEDMVKYLEFLVMRKYEEDQSKIKAPSRTLGH